MRQSICVTVNRSGIFTTFSIVHFCPIHGLYTVSKSDATQLFKNEQFFVGSERSLECERMLLPLRFSGTLRFNLIDEPLSLYNFP